MSELIELSGLKAVMPLTTENRLAYFVYPLSEIVANEMISPLEQAHFIAQLAHESGGFRRLSENLNYSAKGLRAVFGKYFPDDDIATEYERKPEKIANRVYANRMGNGDEASGDGWRYRGRGLIQITGKYNYERFGKWSNSGASYNPDVLESDLYEAVNSALWFWNYRRVCEWALKDNVRSVTRRINGGLRGLKSRKKYLARCKSVLGLEAV